MRYAKAFAAVIATALSAVLAALLTDNAIDTVEWINVAIAAAGALSVFTAPNVPGAPVTKSALAVITAVLVLAVSLIGDGALSLVDWVQLATAALGALGVYAIPNERRVLDGPTAV